MFAQLKGTPMEYSVNDKLREIDVANENVHGSQDYTGKVSFFQCSEAYGRVTSFLDTLNRAVQGHTMAQLRGEEAEKPAGAEGMRKVQLFASEASAAPAAAPKEEESKQQTPATPAADTTTPPSILALQQLLSEVEALIAECPPADRNVGGAASSVLSGSAVPVSAAAASSAAPASRFGSPAFRDFLTLLNERAPAMVERVLATVDPAALARVDIDAPQSAQSAQWEREGHATLREFKRAHAGKGGAHGGSAHTHHAVHKLPPGVVISHGPSGLNNGPGLVRAVAATAAAAEHEHEHDHEHDHVHNDTVAAPSAAAASSSVAAAAPVPASAHSRLVGHLVRYLVSCWGDIRRLDYGTGHELNFLCFLCALGHCGAFDLTNALHARRLVGCVFAPYIKLMRKLQTSYWLEPAGSRGVWGLDDYSFLPFLLGSAQLIGHKNIRPKSVRYPEILDGFSSAYMYLDAISFILRVKTCSFAEHSPMLNDITIIKTWDQVNAGLWRMYLAEVLGKFAVVQHFIYSPLLPAWPRQPLQVSEVKEEAPCCGDSIHFPSAIAAKQTSIEPPRL